MSDDSPIELSKINVILKLFNKELISGSLCISKHHLMIMDLTKCQNDIIIQHKSIDAIKFLNDITLEIKSKDFKVYQLEANSKDILLLNSSLIRASNEERVSELFPFIYKPDFKIIENGWTAFLLREEFTEILMSGLWGLFPANECSSYDNSVIVPIAASDEDIKESARLHVNNRFPVLAFYYKPSQSSLLRCSQYVPNMDRMPSSDPLIRLLTLSHSFIDIRSKQLMKNNHMEARILKNGVFYLDKLETLQSSFQKFIETFQDTTLSFDRYISKLENSQWLDRVRQMLFVSRFVAHALVSQSSNYIVVGDTGFDFELIITSLVQVILHSDARTIRGFEALVDREWIQGGHPFYDRCKHQIVTSKAINPNPTNEIESPVFLLFLDCVWQILQFNPTSFEFNELFLICLAHNCYFSEFGTFIGNNAQHREEHKIPSETTSLWSYINQNENLHKFYNCLYAPSGIESRNYICWPPVLPQNIDIWHELYSGQPVSSIELKRKMHNDTINEYKTCKNLNLKLRKLVENLEKELALSNGVNE